MRSTPFAAVCAIAIAACGTPVPPPRPAASPTRAEPAAPRAILALGTRDAVFLPDGRVAMSVGRAWHLFSPEHPEEGELFSFVGKMHVAGKHVFGVQVTPTNELVELDERFQAIHRLDLGALPLVDTTDDGEYFTAAPNQVGVLYRTRDWKPLGDHVAFTSNGTRTVGRMATTPDGRYAVTSRAVVDLVSGKKVFSHPAPESRLGSSRVRGSTGYSGTWPRPSTSRRARVRHAGSLVQARARPTPRRRSCTPRAPMGSSGLRSGRARPDPNGCLWRRPSASSPWPSSRMGASWSVRSSRLHRTV